MQKMRYGKNIKGRYLLAWVKISQIRTVATERLGKKIERARIEELEEVIDGLMDIIG